MSDWDHNCLFSNNNIFKSNKCFSNLAFDYMIIFRQLIWKGPEWTTSKFSLEKKSFSKNFKTTWLQSTNEWQILNPPIAYYINTFFALAVLGSFY